MSVQPVSIVDCTWKGHALLGQISIILHDLIWLNLACIALEWQVLDKDGMTTNLISLIMLNLC